MQRGKPLGFLNLRAQLSLGEGKRLKKKKRKIEEKIDYFIFHIGYCFSSLCFLFLFFFGCISPLHDLISFSRVFDVV